MATEDGTRLTPIDTVVDSHESIHVSRGEEYHLSMMNRDAQTFQLRDGRKLGFSQYGDRNGKPVFYFHGWPASRLSAAYYDSLGKKLHIRIISPDRPGYGLSDYWQNRTLLDWPDDVVALADHLKLKKFAVMGVSGGGPYAALCAYKISKRLTKVGIVVGLGPILGLRSVQGILWIGKVGWLTFGKYPWIRRISAYMQYIWARNKIFRRFAPLTWGKVDRSLLVNPAMLNRLHRSIGEGFRQGYKGPELDLKLYTSDWGFDLSKIRAKTYLWYGEKDRNASLAMGQYYASQIPGSKLTVYPNEGHLVSVSHAEEILKTLNS